jgi:gliding motility-associated-like protein
VGSADGIANISANGGTGLLKFSIDGGPYSTSSVLSGLLAGSHTISIQDANNCLKDTVFNLNNPNPLVIKTFWTKDPNCFGTKDGTTTIVADGGTGVFEYRIDAGAFGSTGFFSGLTAGPHSIRIRDGNNCTKDTSYSLINPDSISINPNIRKNLCNGTKDGQVILLASGGADVFTYEKNASGSFRISNTFDSLAIGTYTFKAKDANNCTKTISVVIVDSMKLNTSIDLTQISCFGGKDGVILLSPLNGIAPYSYGLGSASLVSSPRFDTLSVGAYTLRIKDAKGCFLDTNATITEPTKLAINATSILPTCNGIANGSITIIGADGTAPYTYSIDISPFVVSPLFSGLAAKNYTLRIKDANGCLKDSTITISQPEPLFLDVKIKIPICNGDANGNILIAANGGTPAYQYAFDGELPQIDPLLINFKAGTYLVKIIDANGCVKDSTVVVKEPEKLKLNSVFIKNPTCENYADGSFLINAMGGTKPYGYSLESSKYTPINFFEKLKEGNYLIHIIDSNNCKADSLITLIGNPKIKLDSTIISSPKCFGTSDGKIQLFASGGNPPMRYTLESAIDTVQVASFGDLKSKNYIITVIDNANCFKSFSTFVPQPEILKASINSLNNNCTGNDSSGRLSVLATGGTAPYQYQWSLGSSNQPALSNLPNGTYSVKITDTNGCVDSINAEILYENCCSPMIPNVFTPNNDGKNDVFRLIYKGDIELKEFSIYNRYGQRIFITNNINDSWNGTFNNQDAELGVYYYMIKFICGNQHGKEMFLKGDVTLIR